MQHETTCGIWKANINFILLGSNNDGFYARMTIFSFVCSLAHIFIYNPFPLCEESRDMASRMLFGRSQCSLGMMEGWPACVLVQETSCVWVWLLKKTTDFCLTALLFGLGSSGGLI